MKKKLLALTLAVSLLAGALAGCTQPQAQTTPTPAPTQVPEATATPTPAGEKADVRLAVLKGPSGVGAVKLIADSKAGETANHYQVTIAAANDEVVAGLSRPDDPIDIAAVASNVAANLYNKTDGAVQVLALNTRGVLYVVTDGTENITSFADLRGKNVCVPVQNPTFIFQYQIGRAHV